MAVNAILIPKKEKEGGGEKRRGRGGTSKALPELRFALVFLQNLMFFLQILVYVDIVLFVISIY
jgi:hypothetical protein